MAQWWGETPKAEGGDSVAGSSCRLRSFARDASGGDAGESGAEWGYVDPSKGERKWDRKEIKNALTPGLGGRVSLSDWRVSEL